MSEEELRKNDILFQIDMQLYDEFNDKLAEMNDHIGEVYTLRDIEEVERAEKEKEIKLLRGAVKKLQKVINLMAIQLSDRPLLIFKGKGNLEVLEEPEKVVEYFYKKAEEEK